MTDRTETIDAALEDHDVTLAFTPGQLVLIVIGVFVLVRILKGLKR